MLLIIHCYPSIVVGAMIYCVMNGQRFKAILRTPAIIPDMRENYDKRLRVDDESTLHTPARCCEIA